MPEVLHEQRQTINERSELAVELAAGKTSVYWCNRNEESATIKRLDSESVELLGSMSIEKKEDILINFAKGNIKRIITKPKMTSFGLNWQHCNHSVFFPTWSYEQYYQSIRRFWRFGQTKDVTIDVVVSDGQQRVIDTIEQKTKKAIQLHQSLTNAVNDSFTHTTKQFNKPILKPNFL
jgi:SNF2 family DNA or RNA helicase